MPLLKAAINDDPNPNKGDQDPTIVDGNSLLSEVGPVGSLVEAQKQSDVFDTGQIVTYVVRAGDTLPEIADAFNVSVKTIQIANDLRTSTIQEGQRLIILPISGIQHTVARGETLQGLAKAYKLDVSDITNYNHLDNGAKLAIGDVLFIPSDEVPVARPSRPSIKSGQLYEPIIPSPVPLIPTTGFFIEPLASYTKTQGLHGHNAVDLAAPIGTPIMAAAAGEVIISRNGAWNGGYGNYIVIQHSNGTQTLYAHASLLLVSEGQHVSQGQIIAKVGTTGKSTGPHLHVEVRGGINPF